MKQALSKFGCAAAFHAIKTAQDGRAVKRTSIDALADIDEKLDAGRVPLRVLNAKTGQREDVPETGAGFDEWGWKGCSLDLDAGTAAVLKGLYDHLVDGPGFPGPMARGVKELGAALVRWTAKVATPKASAVAAPDATPALPAPEPEAAG